MLHTCTLSSDVAIGWANAAKEAEFRAWIAKRMARGFRYGIIEASHKVVYNNATKVNEGVRAIEINTVIRTMGIDFLTSGDISIVHIQRLQRAHCMAETPQDVLDNDTIEFERA